MFISEGVKKIICKRCGNADPSLFGYKNGKYYCRACINFQGKLANIPKRIKPKIVNPNLSYELSSAQKNIATKLTQEAGTVYINAVCGSGKTEMVFQSIDQALSEGKRVGFVIPRREVVKEIYDRLKEVYPSLNITLVYGGHNEYLDGDIIVLTAHQCFRYPNKFGLLILDEYDAFPLKGNKTLLSLVERSGYGKKIFLSATFSEAELHSKTSLELSRRYHGYDLPIPKVIKGEKVWIFFKLLKFILKGKKHTKFIFVPTIKEGKILCFFLRLFLVKVALFTSKIEDKNSLYKAIKKGEKKTIVATTILERGITVKGLRVAVFNASHPLFDYRTLIQIAGRAGRKKDAPMGAVNFYTTSYSKEIDRAIKEIVDKNNRYRYN